MTQRIVDLDCVAWMLLCGNLPWIAWGDIVEEGKVGFSIAQMYSQSNFGTANKVNNVMSIQQKSTQTPTSTVPKETAKGSIRGVELRKAIGVKAS